MFRACIFIGIVLMHLCSIAQPYVDPLNIRYTKAFKTKENNGTPFQHLYIGSDIPVKLKKEALLIFSPFFDAWNIDSAEDKNFVPAVSSIALPVIVQIPLKNKKWALSIAAIPKFNSQDLCINGNTFQLGGIISIQYKHKENFKYKVGLYANTEQFGLFIIPLGGIDWKINSRNYLFGLLPGRLTYEYKLSSRFYTGINFRALTFSYLLNNGRYLRIDDNQLSAYLDCYPLKKIVVSVETGYGVFRKLRQGNGHNKHYTSDLRWNDGAFIKLCASYRIRL